MLASPNLRVIIMVVKTKELDKAWWCPQQNIGFCHGYQMDMSALPIDTTCYDLITPN
jgi:hypothetical protein